MSVIELMRSRRSVRFYRSDSLSEEQINGIVEAGCLAPSAHNHQPWNFVVITNREAINRLSSSARDYLRAKTEADDALEYFGSKKRLERVKTRLALDEDTVFYGAPCVVLVCVDKGSEYAPMDCGMAGQNMCLYAREQGIGSCFIGYARHCEHKELEKVGMKEDQELMFGMTFGFSDDLEGKGLDRDFDKIQEWVR